MRAESSKNVLLIGSFALAMVRFRGALIAEMIGHGHSVVAAAPDMDQDTAEALRKIGAKPRNLSIRNTSLNPLALFSSLAAMRALIRDEHPDVMIAYGIMPVILSALSGRREGVPTIVSVITGAGYAFTGGREAKRVASRAAATLLYRLALKKADTVVFLNPDDERLFRRLRLLPRDKVSHVIDGEGVDLDHFAASPVPERTSFLMIARLVKDKGIREFAEAAKRIKAAHPDVPIALVGDFYPSPHSLSREEFDELIACGIDYQGFRDDVRPAISECSVYVLPSYREGTPVSVLEAMAMGRAILTTDAPGCRETVIEGENGLLVPARDAGSLYRSMISFIDEPELARTMGAASRKLAESKYDVRSVNANLLRYAGLSC